MTKHLDDNEGEDQHHDLALDAPDIVHLKQLKGNLESVSHQLQEYFDILLIVRGQFEMLAILIH